MAVGLSMALERLARELPVNKHPLILLIFFTEKISKIKL